MISPDFAATTFAESSFAFETENISGVTFGFSLENQLAPYFFLSKIVRSCTFEDTIGPSALFSERSFPIRSFSIVSKSKPAKTFSVKEVVGAKIFSPISFISKLSSFTPSIFSIDTF